VADSQTLGLIRDYEGQIALYKLRIEHLEEEAKNRQRMLDIAYDPRRWEEPDGLHIAGMQFRDFKAIYEMLDEWHKIGGDPALLDGWREWSAQKQESAEVSGSESS
jgi:hypothetical protein